MRFFNWLFGRKQGVRYNPYIEFGTGAKINLPEGKVDFESILGPNVGGLIGYLTTDGEYIPITKQNKKVMIDPNHPAFPVVHVIDGNWVKNTPRESMGLTIRAEIATRILSATIGELKTTPDDDDIAWHVRISLKIADEFIKQLNETT